MAVAAPARRQAPARRPARTRRPSPARRQTPHLIPLAVGRTATAVGRLPDSGLVVRMTRGRAWIGVLGLLLAGIVALNVLTLSFTASSGKVDSHNQALDQENSVLRSRAAQKFSAVRVRHQAGLLGLEVPSVDEVGYRDYNPADVATAAQRLAAAAGAG